jgi:hypothetical protein
MKAILTTVVVLIVIHFGLLEYRMNDYIVKAHRDNVAPLSKTVRNVTAMLVNATDVLDDTRQVVDGVVISNRNLKASLKESVRMLQDQIEENNALHAKIEDLEWALEFLQDIVDKKEVDNAFAP